MLEIICELTLCCGYEDALWWVGNNAQVDSESSIRDTALKWERASDSGNTFAIDPLFSEEAGN